MGHYKTILEDIRKGNNSIAQVIIDIAYISLVPASPLRRWQRAFQVMLDKGKGRLVNNLRIIQFVEADLNMVLNTIWGTRLIRQAKHSSALDDSQYALPGQTCPNTVMNKVLFLDLSRQTLTSGVLTDFGASAALDRVLGSLSVLTCERVGLPRTAGHFMYSLLKNMNNNLITGFRTSTDSFNNSENGETGQGVLQGSSSAAPIYILTSDISLSTYKKSGIGATFIHPITKKTITKKNVQFVDDTSQFLNELGTLNTSAWACTNDSKERLYNASKNNLKTWTESMWTSGGNLNVDKCYYFA
jgi:hypothetical protein